MVYAFNKNARMTWVSFINSFPCLFISSSAFNCCGKTFQNILFHSLHLYNIIYSIVRLIQPPVKNNFLTITLEFRYAWRVEMGATSLFEFQ